MGISSAITVDEKPTGHPVNTMADQLAEAMLGGVGCRNIRYRLTRVLSIYKETRLPPHPDLETGLYAI
jgi:hypothetical protein